MNRVQTLLQLLQQQSDKKESNDVLLQTVQLLQAELVSGKAQLTAPQQGKIVVILPVTHIINNAVNGSSKSLAQKTELQFPEQEKDIQVLHVDEKEIEQELEEIKKNAQVKNKMSVNARPTLPFDPVEDVPTLTHQKPAAPAAKPKEINEAALKQPASLNERLKEARTELSDKLTDGPIKDLKKAIGVNDRFLFINELFRGDEAMYERSIKTINNFSIFAEAEYWIKRELKIKIGWTDADPVVKQFDQLVRRRFF